jgi:GNAT superfamily N-acetyltransferase
VTGAPVIEGFTVRPFEERDAPALQALFETDPEYFSLADGFVDDIQELDQVRATLPPGCSRDDKFLFVICKGARIAGMIDIIRGFPERSTWYLPLLFLAKDLRSQGHGRRGLHAIYAWVRQQGGAAVSVTVAEGNSLGRWLYATEGFVFKGAREPDAAAHRLRRTLILERAL